MPQARRPRTMVPIAVLAIGAIGASAGGVTEPAHATSLGGLLPMSLGVWSEQTTAPPPPVQTGSLACDDFEGANGPLDGRATGCGPVWSAPTNWEVAAGTVTATGSGGSAIVPIGLADVTVAVDIIGGNANNRRAGVVLSHEPGDPTYLAAVLQGAATVRLEVHRGGSIDVLASATVTETDVWRLIATRDGDTVAVTVNGAAAIAVTLAPTVSALLTGTDAGLYKGQGPPVEFDHFEVTSA